MDIRNDLLAKIGTALGLVTNQNLENLTEQSTASDVQGWDSLANVRLFIELEKMLNIRFRATEMDGLANVGEMISMIMEKLD